MGAHGARLLATVPFCGTFGNVAAMAAVAGAAELVCLDIFDPHVAAALIRDRRITHLFGDDRMIGRLADAADGAPFDGVRFSAIAAFQSDAVRSEEHTSELQSLMRISYAVFCLKKKK